MDFVPPKDGIFLSTMPVGPGQRRLALAVVAVATVLFLASAPFAKIQLERVDAFIPVYETALITFDLITAVLLFGQFAFLRSRAIRGALPARRFSRPVRQAGDKREPIRVRRSKNLFRRAKSGRGLVAKMPPVSRMILQGAWVRPAGIRGWG